MALAWTETHPVLRTQTTSGKRLILRAWEPEDTDAVYQACQDPEIVLWTTVLLPYHREYAESITTSSLSTWRDHTGVTFAVMNEATNAVLASTSLVEVNEPDSAVEIGYWVAPWARRRSVATAATKAVATRAIEELGALRVSLEAATTNDGSQQVAPNAGFILEGVQNSKAARFDERFDMALFSLLPGEERNQERRRAGNHELARR